MGVCQCSGLRRRLVVLLVMAVQYSIVVEKIAPLEEEYGRLKANLDVSQQKLAALTNELEKVRPDVSSLPLSIPLSSITMLLSSAVALSDALLRAPSSSWRLTRLRSQDGIVVFTS
jgi:hypothetical protein